MPSFNVKGFLNWLAQPSTIKAIVMFAALFSYKLAPDHMEAIFTAAAVLYGGVAAFWDEN